jgi:hypothetical protein
MNNDRFATLRRWFLPMLCLALAVPATPALAERNFSAWRPGSAKKATAAVLQLAPAADPGVRVGPIDRAEIAAMRAENAVAGLRALKLGVVRAVSGEPGTGPASLAWHAVPGGHAAQWHVTADEARAHGVGAGPLTLAERRALWCQCPALDGTYHHRRGCPVPAVDAILAARPEAPGPTA